MRYTMTRTEYDRTAAELTAAAEAPQNPATVESVRDYLTRTASEQIERYTRAARNALFWAKVDREAGNRESAACFLWSAAHFRQIAAEWIARYNRVTARAALAD